MIRKTSVVAGLTMCLLLLSCQQEHPTTRAHYQSLTETVYASALVQPVGTYQAFASKNGVLEAVYIAENDLVENGQVLAKLQSIKAQIGVESARLNQQLAQQNYTRQTAVLRNIQDQIQAAQLQLRTDSLNYARQQKLWQQDIGAKAELDRRQLAYELAVNQLQSLRNRYRQAQAERDEQYQTQVQIASRNVQASQATREDHLITSRRAGKVYTLHKEAGEAISIQDPLASIGAADSFLLELEVDEVDIARLRLGQKIVLTLDAYAHKIFTAEISKIYPQKQMRTQTFKVEGRFTQAPTVLYAGLSGEANIIVSTKNRILSIPLSYLVGTNQVRTPEGLVEVETGVRNMEQVEIISGIDSTTVLLQPE